MESVLISTEMFIEIGLSTEMGLSWGSRSTIEGGGDVTNLSPFWEETARKYPLPGTYLTNDQPPGEIS